MIILQLICLAPGIYVYDCVLPLIAGLLAVGAMGTSMPLQSNWPTISLACSINSKPTFSATRIDAAFSSLVSQWTAQPRLAQSETNRHAVAVAMPLFRIWGTVSIPIPQKLLLVYSEVHQHTILPSSTAARPNPY
jgi:hypothetical protein